MLARGIIWVVCGVLLTLVPLLIVAVMAWAPKTGTSGLVDILSNEELLAVAFTLGGVAAVDVLTNASTYRPYKLAVGSITLLMTFVGLAGYVLLKANLTKLSSEDAIATVQWIYCLTVVGSFMCEMLSEA